MMEAEPAATSSRWQMGGGPATLRALTSSTILTSAFLTAAVANLLFFTGLGGFVLLPLHLRGLGAPDGQVGLIMACLSLQR
jgi:hypothetical protein